uniref:Uncharacterized protein n=1 Tax=Aegilops tauschii subsp. strangulata TaxID=200361 RepID=A0A453T1H8_AEGTS
SIALAYNKVKNCIGIPNLLIKCASGMLCSDKINIIAYQMCPVKHKCSELY